MGIATQILPEQPGNGPTTNTGRTNEPKPATTVQGTQPGQARGIPKPGNPAKKPGKK